ncbi:hydantoinase/carbamoylase family amidase [Anaerosphaera multitolerans]|uniref:hydantoinase/carbamoylase family amidase n=1 Tax=Anaerosphaera multitolerans TaxID=2487351 RepID=UPI00196B6959|nr:hydantoinase/carbamoylase family amidase [Anaerosphaera multitolerans]
MPGIGEPGFIEIEHYIELHVEQGPILDKEEISIGVVENLQGISWQEVTILGEANHAGTTPTYLRKDAGLVAAKINTYLRERANINKSTVATIGTMEFKPNAINIIPAEVKFTIDFRNPDNETLLEEENKLKEFYKELEKTDGVKIKSQQLVRFDPVKFDKIIVNIIEEAVKKRGFTYKKMTSGAGHDAQMISRIAPTAMIFVPSIGGISHNPNEKTEDKDIENGANVLLDVCKKLTKNN